MFMEDESMCELMYDMMEPMATNGVSVQSVRIECFRQVDDMEAMKGTLCLAGAGLVIFITAMACRERGRGEDRAVRV